MTGVQTCALPIFLVKNAEDGTKIVEQILPYFTPDFTVSVNLIPEMGISMEIPVVLTGIEQQDTYNGGFTERQSLTWTLNFTVKGYLYGPVRTSKVIKYSNTNFYIPETADIISAIGNTAASATIHIQPGLTANGQPTSNSSLSVPVSQILATDDFGFVTNISEFST